jgi:hypothetical protein
MALMASLAAPSRGRLAEATVMTPMITPMTPAVTRSGHALCSSNATTLAAQSP